MMAAIGGPCVTVDNVPDTESRIWLSAHQITLGQWVQWV